MEIFAFEEVLDAWEYGTTEKILLAGFLRKEMRELVETQRQDYGGLLALERGLWVMDGDTCLIGKVKEFLVSLILCLFFIEWFDS
jgi:hypothetical protein